MSLDMKAKMLWYCRVHHTALAERRAPCWEVTAESKRKHKECGWVLAIPVEIEEKLGVRIDD